ncbi:unnamed protein product [Prorocentrum cordatum]|uniref:Calmodulin n=1 Tax=Prorocentrum cordatum TaxID=2364126 RepID=A0ABN9Y745_9DINO|nr:unnamed protein product [Polarella glacialis]
MAAGAPGASSSRSAYSQFLDKLKHPSAKAVANDVHGFVTAFPPGLPRQEAARRVRVFLSDAAPRLLLAEAFAADGSDNQQELVEEGLEKFVVLKLYNVLFQQIPTDTGEDKTELRDSAPRAWRWRGLGGPPAGSRVGDVGRLVAQAAAELQKVNRYRAPRDKLGCMLNAYRLIESFVDAFQRDAAGDAPREEAFLNQVLTTTLKEAMPENFFSNVVFVSTYRHPSRISPEEQRCLQSFTNAAASLESGADAGDGADRAALHEQWGDPLDEGSALRVALRAELQAARRPSAAGPGSARAGASAAQPSPGPAAVGWPRHEGACSPSAARAPTPETQAPGFARSWSLKSRMQHMTKKTSDATPVPTVWRLRRSHTSDSEEISVLSETPGLVGWARRKLSWLVHRHGVAFDYAICLVIVASSICVGVEIQCDLEGSVDCSRTTGDLEHFFLVVFVLELLIRFLAEGPRVFKNAWVQFDTILVATGVISTWVIEPIVMSTKGDDRTAFLGIISQMVVLRVLRLLRLVRALRFFEQFQEMWKLANGLIRSFRTVLSACFLILLTIYVFGCLGVELITKDIDLLEDPVTAELIQSHFSSLQVTMLTLIQFANSDSIASVYKPLVCRAWPLLFYFGFVWLIVTITLMNLIQQSLWTRPSPRAAPIGSSRRRGSGTGSGSSSPLCPNSSGTLIGLDWSGDGKVSMHEFRSGLDASNTKKRLPEDIRKILDSDQLVEVYGYLDADGSGEIDEEEFIDGIFSLMFQSVPIETTQMLQLLRSQSDALHRWARPGPLSGLRAHSFAAAAATPPRHFGRNARWEKPRARVFTALHHRVAVMETVRGGSRQDWKELLDSQELKGLILQCQADFASAYMEQRREHSHNTYSFAGDNRAPLFTMEELTEAMRLLKLHKAAGDNGVSAELIKIDSAVLRDLLLGAFNEILSPSAAAPTGWLRAGTAFLSAVPSVTVAPAPARRDLPGDDRCPAASARGRRGRRRGARPGAPGGRRRRVRRGGGSAEAESARHPAARGGRGAGRRQGELVMPKPGKQMRVAIAGGGVGGLTTALCMLKEGFDVTVYEKTGKFARFGGPIQFASNATSTLKAIDERLFQRIMDKFTFTATRRCGIKDGKRADGSFRMTEVLDPSYLVDSSVPADWFVSFPLKECADFFQLPYTGVINRPDLQDILLDECRQLKPDFIQNGVAVQGYENHAGGVTVKLSDGSTAEADVLVGSDGIWSAVRSQMYGEGEVKGSSADGKTRQGCPYSGYTVFAGETVTKLGDYYDCGYKDVYIGPQRYFVTSDVGDGRIQWYAFLALPPGTKKRAPEDTWEGSGSSSGQGQDVIEWLKGLHEGWSSEVFQVLEATPAESVEQRDLYDRRGGGGPSSSAPGLTAAPCS